MAVDLDSGSVEIVADDMSLRQVLEELFLMMEVNYDLPPEVLGAVTASIHNATYRQALELLLGHEFTYDIGPDDIIYIHRTGTTWRPGNEHIA